MEAQTRQNSTIDLSVAELTKFAQQGQLPESVLSYRRENENRLPANLYVPLAAILNNDMAARERAEAIGKPIEARPSTDMRTALYAEDSIMRDLLEPFRQERTRIQQTPLSADELQGLQQGKVPQSITGYLNDYQGELPTNAIKPVSEAVIDTTLTRQGVMYPQFELLYTRSLELPGLVDEPIKQGLKDQALIPFDSQSWRQEIAQQRSESEAVKLGIAEGIQTNEMSIALPDNARQLRQYLENDNYLSNEEIAKAIFDDKTSRDQMKQLVDRIDSTGKGDVREKVTDYLMELKDTTQQFPAIVQNGPHTPIDTVSLIGAIRNEQSGEQAQTLPPTGEVIKNMDLLDRIGNTINKPDSQDYLNSLLSTSGVKQDATESNQKRISEEDNKPGLLTKVLQIKLLEGGMVSNFLANYKTIQDILDKLFSPKVVGTNEKKPEQDIQQSGLASLSKVSMGQLVRELEQRTRPVVGQVQEQKVNSEGQAQKATNENQAQNATSQSIQPKSIVSRLMDHFLDKLALKLIDHLQARQQETPQQPTTQQHKTDAPAQIQANRQAISQATEIVNKRAEDIKQSTFPENNLQLLTSTAQTPDQQRQAIPETARQQADYVNQPKRYSWEQIKPQMDKLGVSERSIDPMNKALLLDGHATQSNVTFSIRDKNGITAPVQGRLVLIEIPGKGPQVHIEPAKLKTSFNIPKELSLYPEDVMRLQKTGMANRPITHTDPQTKLTKEVIVGYDPQTRQIRTIDKDRVIVPTQIKGQELSIQQQELLRNGKQITLSNLTSETGKAVSATLQFSATEGKFRLDRVGTKQQEMIAQSNPISTTQRQSPEKAIYLKPLNPEKEQIWLKTSVDVKTETGSQQQKQVKDLTYSDSVLVGPAGNKTYKPLTDKPEGNNLVSPSEQARLLTKLYSQGLPPGVTVKPANPQQVNVAKDRFKTQTTTKTSVVSKNGSTRITQDQTGNLKQDSKQDKTKNQSKVPSNKQEHNKEKCTKGPRR